MSSRAVRLLIRTGILVGLSMVLVFGFWEHRSFYQFGLPLLLLGGGLVTFLVILGFRLALSGELPSGRPIEDVVLSSAEADGILRGTVEILIRPADLFRNPVGGRIVRGRLETGREFRRFRVLDATRKRLDDVTDAEARRAGYRSVADLRTDGGQRFRDLVALLRVEVAGGRA